VEDKTYGIDFLAGFVIGALVGAAAALLLAPQSGEDTRLQIRDKGIEIKGRAEDLQGQARDRADQLQVRMKEAVEEGKTAATKKKEELLSQLDGKQPLGELEIDTQSV
jgi:gas vesicle protein